jgi:hypothetical protein
VVGFCTNQILMVEPSKKFRTLKLAWPILLCGRTNAEDSQCGSTVKVIFLKFVLSNYLECTLQHLVRTEYRYRINGIRTNTVFYLLTK